MQGYYPDKPSRPQDYMDSEKESLKVERKMKTPDDEYFELTDSSPTTAFIQYLDWQGLDSNPDEMLKIIHDTQPTLMSLKITTIVLDPHKLIPTLNHAKVLLLILLLIPQDTLFKPI